MNYDWRKWTVLLGACLAAALSAQQAQRPAEKKAFQAQAPSTASYSVKDGQETMEITNVVYEMTGNGVPGRPINERLMLRKTVHTKAVVDEIGMEGSTTIEAWPLGVNDKQKPRYTLKVAGVEPQTLHSDLLVVARGLEEVEWWSAYALGTGAHLFDTYVPVLSFAIGGPSR